jgi:uncharacterized protein YoxC
MIADITREEFESRVGVLEREVEGEKMVTRHILEQTRRNGDDLAAVKTKLDGVEAKVDSAEASLGARVDTLGARIDALAVKVDGLIKSLPKIVGDVMRGVLNGRSEA